MDQCPEKPDFFQLIRGWFQGNRPLEAYLAIGGTLLLLFLTLVALMLAVHGS